MRRQTLAALISTAIVLTGNVAQAGGANVLVDNERLQVQLVITEKLPSSDTEFSQGREGHYVFIASARPDDVIQTSAISQAAACTGIRPRFGLTQQTVGGFNFPAYASYYGPYADRQEAVRVRAAVALCVSDAYVRSGIIQRF